MACISANTILQRRDWREGTGFAPVFRSKPQYEGKQNKRHQRLFASSQKSHYRKIPTQRVPASAGLPSACFQVVHVTCNGIAAAGRFVGWHLQQNVKFLAWSLQFRRL